MKRKTFESILSGHGPGHRLARTGLQILEPIYRSAVHWRNRRYDRQTRLITCVDVPVVSIGNLTTGGTGKTPMVRWAVQQLVRAGHRPVIISRGYGSQRGQPNDEYHELKLFLPEVPHIQNADRVLAATEAVQDYHASVLVLDDGFQHRRLHRDVDIVLIDATCPFGYGHLLPRGLLREPIDSLARADAVIITRADQVSEGDLQAIRRQLRPWLEPSRIATAHFPFDGWIDRQGHALQPNSIDPAKEPVYGFCGIGNPGAFHRVLSAHCANLIHLERFPDHHRYSEKEWIDLVKRAQDRGAKGLVCTVKDLVKIRQLSSGGLPVYALSIQVQIGRGESMLEQLITSQPDQGPDRSSATVFDSE